MDRLTTDGIARVILTLANDPFPRARKLSGYDDVCRVRGTLKSVSLTVPLNRIDSEIVMIGLW